MKKKDTGISITKSETHDTVSLTEEKKETGFSFSGLKSSSGFTPGSFSFKTDTGLTPGSFSLKSDEKKETGYSFAPGSFSQKN